MPPYDWANGGSVDIFWGYGEYGFSTVGVFTILGNSQSVSGASHQPAFLGNCLTISHTCLPYPHSR